MSHRPPFGVMSRLDPPGHPAQHTQGGRSNFLGTSTTERSIERKPVCLPGQGCHSGTVRREISPRQLLAPGAPRRHEDTQRAVVGQTATEQFSQRKRTNSFASRRDTCSWQ